MNLRILIPVRPFEAGKQRLASRLPAPQRRALNARLFLRTLDVVREVAPAADCIVVSRSPEALEIARNAGMQPLPESHPAGLDAALAQAAAHARTQGADAVLSVSCDLPLLCPPDLQALLRRHTPGGIVLATDAACTGTNALLVSPPGAIAYRHGPGSRRAHLALAAAAGLRSFCLRRRGTAFDLDTPADLATLSRRTDPDLLTEATLIQPR